MPLVQMDIQTLIVGAGPVASVVVLKRHNATNSSMQLPIRIGAVEALAISMGIDDRPHARPLTHDLVRSLLSTLGATLSSVSIVDVQGTTFYAQLSLFTLDGRHLSVDCRPSDAIALALRCEVPIYAEESVLETASVPNFRAIEQEEESLELERFHEFVESLSPEDFFD